MRSTLQTYCVCIYLATVTGLNASATVYLFANDSEVFEGDTLSLTCLIDIDNSQGFSGWYIQEEKNKRDIGTIKYKSCVADGQLNESNKYGHDCFNHSVYTLIIKNVSLTQHNETWICEQVFKTSNSFVFHVNVPVKQVSLESNAQNVTGFENTTVSVRFSVTTPCRPEPTVKCFLETNSNFSLWTHMPTVNADDSPKILTTNVTFTLEKYMNRQYIVCDASNRNLFADPVRTNKLLLDVYYPPENNLNVEGIENGSRIYNIIHGNSVTLSCTITGGNPAAQLRWIESLSEGSIQNSQRTVTAKLTWTAIKKENKTLQCQSIQLVRNETVTVTMNVLYRPEQIKVNLTIPGISTYPNISNVFSVIKGTILVFHCLAEGNPTPTAYSWEGVTTSKNAELEMQVNTANGYITCLVTNDLKETNTNISTLGQGNETYFFYSLYPPQVVKLQNSTIRKGKDFKRHCIEVTGNTTKQTFWWQTPSGSLMLNENLTLTNVSRKNTGRYTCEVHYDLHPTYGKNESKTVQEHLFLDILYPPEGLLVEIKAESDTATNVSKYFSVLENTLLTLICNAEGNPVPSFSWTGLNVSNTSILYVQTKKQRNGNVTCTAFNSIRDSDETKTTIESINSTYFIDVLYAPDIAALGNESVIEGNNMTKVCNVTPGNPTEFAVQWLLSGINISNSAVLYIENISRKNSSEYTCSVNSSIFPTIGRPVDGRKSATFFLDVLYPPEKMEVRLQLDSMNISNLNNTLVVIENTSMTITLLCSAFGNPVPKQFYWDGVIRNNSALLHIPVLRNVSGSYTCNTSNTILSSNTDQRPVTTSIERTYFVDVFYVPEFKEFDEHKVIEGGVVNITCVNVGKTTEQTVKWISMESGYVEERNDLIITNISREDNGTYICEIRYLIKETYGKTLNETKRRTLQINVLFPPENITVMMNTNTEHIIPSRLLVIENTSLHLTCLASGNPDPKNYSWSGIRGSETRILSFRLTRNLSGSYTCNAKNAMQPADNQLEIGSRNKTYIIDTLYGPTVSNLKNVTIYAEDKFTAACITDPGKTTSLIWCWVKDNGEGKCNENLTIHKATTNDTGWYKCKVSYAMVPTYGENMSSQNEIQFYLNISFKGINLEIKDAQVHESSNTGAAVGGALAGVTTVVLATVVGVYIVRKRRQLTRPPEEKKHHEYQNVTYVPDRKHDKRLPAPPPLDEVDNEPETPTNSNARDSYTPNEVTYLNSMELIEIIKKIQTSELFTYVANKTEDNFFEEYEKLPKGIISTIPCTIARKPENASLNRYQGIYPYDHSRVHILGQPDFFINANHIDGFTRTRAYIASLGPTARHTIRFTAFWNMVWHEKSDVIVMLTNLVEPSGMKCEKYWADYGTSRDIGEFIIQSQTEDITAEYTVRTLTVSKGNESRSVTQLHYTAWPDKTVPESVTSLVEFRQRVKAAPTKSLGPLIVHCSAGIGRTGTYIALDRLIEEGRSTDAVNVFDCLMNMRKQRVNMVQTVEQYVYLHHALAYCLTFDIEPVTADEIDHYVQTTSDTVYSQIYQQLKQTVEKESEDEYEAKKRNSDLVDFNRRRADIPGDTHRVRLHVDKEMGESDYINAVYLGSFLRLEHFIIAQSPLPRTVDDFVGMLYQEKCYCIVSLDDYHQKGTNNATYVPEVNQESVHGYFTISCSSVEIKSTYVLRKLKVRHAGKYETGERIVHHFEFTGWKHDDRLPKDAKIFVEFVKEVEVQTNQLADENSHVVVQCMTGSERSGLFCAVSNLIQKIELEKQVSIVNTLRRIRERRKTAIPTMEQLKFCYQAVNEFVKILRSNSKK